ncbi:MAG: hypothetical protein IH991_10640 [Planctomycetes bacterium]|nr:hypothetical protein [Planctomycetota bacterium]
MEFRQRGQRDERRRRVLLDDTSFDRAGASSTTSQDENAYAKSRLYREGTLTEHQPRTIDLLPKRFWVFSLLVLFLALFVVGVNLLGNQHAEWSEAVAPADLSAINLQSRGNLATWFASALLALAAMISWQIYALRRHKVDDYRGRYRLWLWAGAALMLASIDATAGLHRIVDGSLERATGIRLFGEASGWWMITFGIVFGAIAVRMGIEMRRSWSSLAALVIALSGYTVSALAKLNLIAGNASAIVAVNGAIIGHSMVLLCTALYARFIYNDARTATVGAERSSSKKTRSRNIARPDRPDDPERQHQLNSEQRQQQSIPKKTAVIKDKQPATVGFEKQPSKKKKAEIGKHQQEKTPQPDAAKKTIHPSRLSKSQRKRLRKQQRREQEEQSQPKAV